MLLFHMRQYSARSGFTQASSHLDRRAKVISEVSSKRAGRYWHGKQKGPPKRLLVAYREPLCPNVLGSHLSHAESLAQNRRPCKSISAGFSASGRSLKNR